MQVGDTYNPKGLFQGLFVPRAIARLPRERLSPGAKMMFSALTWHTTEAGVCEVLAKTLGEDLGVSERQAREYIFQLEREGFVRQVQQGPSVASYEFCWNDVLESCVKKDRKKTAGQEKRPEENPVLTGRKLPVTLSNKEVIRIQPEELSVVSLSDLDLEDPIESFVVNVARRERRLRVRLGRKQDAPLVERLQNSEARMGRESFRRNLVAFYRSSDQWLRENEWPLNRFLKSPEEYTPVVEGPGEVSTVNTPPKVVFPHPPTADAPSVVSVPSPVDLITAWNCGVPSGPPVEVWKPDKQAKEAYREAIGDPQFIAGLPKILERVEAAHKADPVKASYVTFRWVLANWPKVLNGEIAWVSAGSSPVKSKLGRQPQSLADRLREHSKKAM